MCPIRVSIDVVGREGVEGHGPCRGIGVLIGHGEAPWTPHPAHEIFDVHEACVHLLQGDRLNHLHVGVRYLWGWCV